ncbi:MAG: DUF4345 domain-containing protein [Myxococcales bacterium FL481]|nr:MAG: DUF4345 domain-containing protein [Myxococcales bacterium FL481]
MSFARIAPSGARRIVTSTRSRASSCPGIKLADDVDMLSEMRGMGTYTLLAGLLALAGAVVPQLRTLSFGVAVVIFVGYAVGRITSRFVDGKPGPDTVSGTVAESVLGALNLVGLVVALG